jgi:ATP-dependent exoDNAse (exonuclease V) alpha subunit
MKLKNILNDINICFTNKKRKEINHIKMKEVYHKYYRKGLELAALKYDKRTQDVILNKGVPIISKVNSEDMNLVNNQRFVIEKIGPLQMTIQDDLGNTRDIYNNDFQKYFLVAYATTIHSAQGLSIGENYTIHEWDRLDERLKYVSLSRARNYENIHIME